MRIVKTYKSKSLRVIRLVCSIVGAVCANLCIYVIDSGQSIWLAYLLGVLSVLSLVIAYLAYRELGQRPTDEQHFTDSQVQLGLLLVGVLTVMLAIYIILTSQDNSQRIAMFVILILAMITFSRIFYMFLKSRKK